MSDGASRTGPPAPERIALFSSSALVGLLFAGILAVAVLTLVTGRPFPFELSALSLAFAGAWLLLLAFLRRFVALEASWRVLGLWAALGAALRICAFLALGGLEGVSTGNDYAAYHALASNLLEGEGFLAPTRSYGSVRALYPPLYPMLLAAAGSVFGVSHLTVLLLNTATDLTSASLLYMLGRRLGESKAGIAAAALLLTWPSFVVTAPLAQKEGLVMLIMLLLALLLAKMDECGGPTWRCSAAIGATAALAALAQPALALFILCLAPVLLVRLGFRTLLILSLRALPFALLVFLPWWVRNWLIFGQFVPLTTSMGPSMMSAATGLKAPWTGAMLELPEPSRSALDVRQAIRLIAADPLTVLARSLNSVGHGLLIEQYDAVRIARFEPGFPRAMALLPAMTLAYAVTAWLGFLSALRRSSRGQAFVLLLMLACLIEILLFGMWFEFGQRHRVFMMPFLFLLAGLAVASRGPIGGRLQAKSETAWPAATGFAERPHKAPIRST